MSVDLTVDASRRDAIEHTIHSEQSPVGIDAKETHVIIIDRLIRLEDRLARLEEALAQRDSQGS